MRKLIGILLTVALCSPFCLQAKAASYSVYSLSGLVESVHLAADNMDSDFALTFFESEGLLQRWTSDPAFAQEVVSGAGIVGCTYTLGVDPMQVHVGSFYPGTRILYAWRTGNTSCLSAREAETLRAARELIDRSGAAYAENPYRVITEALIASVTYDEATYGSAQLGTDLYENDTAIGALLNGAADCDGYADACVLLYTMLGAQARYMPVTYNNGIPHMVVQLCLSGEWRIVDVCSDDGGAVSLWQHYGLTSQQARMYYSWTEPLYAYLQ